VFPEAYEARGFARAAHVAARYRARGSAGACFRGEESPGEHRPDDLTLARAGVAARTDSRGEQSFEVGVPAAYRRARRVGAGEIAARLPPSTVARNRGPGPCVRQAFGRAVAKGRLDGESTGKTPGSSRLAAVEREPTRKKRPARAGTAPREGKALKGDSRDASGMEQGREASGRHGNRRAPRGARTIRDRSQNRREGQEP